MTPQILFIIVIMIGAFYARKYGTKAEIDIKNYNQKKNNIKLTKSLNLYKI